VRRRLRAAALAIGLVGAWPAVPPAQAARATGRWVVAQERAVPLQWFQGLAHAPGGGQRFFVGIFQGVTRTDRALRPRLRTEAAIPPDVEAQYGFNHVGDPTYDTAEGGRLLLPLECFVLGAPNGGNTCGRGAIGVLDPLALTWRYLVLLDQAEIAKAMWAEVSPDGSLLWTSSGADLLAYRTADLIPATAAPAAPIRAVRRLPGAVPPGGVTGAAFQRGRLLLSEPGAGRLRIWSVDVMGAGARRLEATLPVDAEAEGLDVLPTGDGLLHWLLSPVVLGRTPTYGFGHSEIVSLVPRAAARLRVSVARRAGRLAVRVAMRLLGRARPVAGALVGADGSRGRTDAAGRVTLRSRPGRTVVTVVARRKQLRGRVVVGGGGRGQPAARRRSSRARRSSQPAPVPAIHAIASANGAGVRR